MSIFSNSTKQNKVKIGCRRSKLSLFQANQVKEKLNDIGLECSISTIKSKGDISLKPIEKFNEFGIFTSTLDEQLLSNKIDIAVHSLKDVPTNIDTNITIAALLNREFSQDILVYKDTFFKKKNKNIATGSIRRKAFWKNKFPNDSIFEIRGNVETRINKLNDDKNLDGSIFAKSGLERLKIKNINTLSLDWMIAAPGQGAICVVCKKDYKLIEKIKLLNHQKTLIETSIEREFMNTLNAGCSSPVAATASIENEIINVKAAVLSKCGSKKLYATLTKRKEKWKEIGKNIANILINKGAMEIIRYNKS